MDGAQIFDQFNLYTQVSSIPVVRDQVLAAKDGAYF
jgi:hypothetical protein